MSVWSILCLLLLLAFRDYFYGSLPTNSNKEIIFTSSVVAFKLTASVQLDSWRKRLSCGTSPLVETVTLRGLKWSPWSCTIISAALMTLSMLWRGSPMPYNKCIATISLRSIRRNFPPMHVKEKSVGYIFFLDNKCLWLK